MTRKTANDFHPQALKLFDQYVHGQLSRRDFLHRAAQFAAAGVTAEGLLMALSPRFAEAQQVKADDARIKTRYVEYPSPKGYGKLRGYMAQPARAKGKLPTVLVAHENRGLNPHIEDIARRLAVDNFIALFGKLDQAKTREDFLAAEDVLKHLPEGNGKVGVVGFCYGGGIANISSE